MDPPVCRGEAWYILRAHKSDPSYTPHSTDLTDQNWKQEVGGVGGGGGKTIRTGGGFCTACSRGRKWRAGPRRVTSGCK